MGKNSKLTRMEKYYEYRKSIQKYDFLDIDSAPTISKPEYENRKIKNSFKNRRNFKKEENIFHLYLKKRRIKMFLYISLCIILTGLLITLIVILCINCLW